MEIKDSCVSQLKKYFTRLPYIEMAFIFGSYAKGVMTEESDIDIAVYFTPIDKPLDFESDHSFPQENDIWRDMEKITGLETDFVVLNRAPAILVHSILEENITLVVKNIPLYWHFYLLATSEAEDFRDFVMDFWQIKQRSTSISEIDKARLARITDFLESEVEDYRSFTELTKERYSSQSHVRRNVERFVENIVNSSIDAAKIILASQRLTIPQTYRETLHNLASIKNFPENIAEEIAGYSKLRNILAHDYLDIRYQQIVNFIKTSEPSYRKLIHFVKSTYF